MSKPIVVVTDLSNRIIYYQWFVYGFMLLDKSGIIKLKFDLPLSQKLYVINHAQFFVRCLNKIKNHFQGNKEIKTEAYFRGYVLDEKGKHTFCIDSADSPNMFSGTLLRFCDVYFKIQCPKEFDSKGFKIGNEYIPFLIQNLKIQKMRERRKQSANYVQRYIYVTKK